MICYILRQFDFGLYQLEPDHVERTFRWLDTVGKKKRNISLVAEIALVCSFNISLEIWIRQNATAFRLRRAMAGRTVA